MLTNAARMRWSVADNHVKKPHGDFSPVGRSQNSAIKGCVCIAIILGLRVGNQLSKQSLELIRRPHQKTWQGESIGLWST